jgi:hypothetical protein
MTSIRASVTLAIMSMLSPSSDIKARVGPPFDESSIAHVISATKAS